MAIHEFANDHRSGSTELALRACRILEKFAPHAADSLQQVRGLNHLAQALAEAQPSMAAVLSVCNRCLAASEKGEPPKTAAKRVARELRQMQAIVAHRAAALIPSGATVLTYSYSSSVLAALLESWKSGCRFRVLCSEGRPQLEGRVLAEGLAQKRIPVELFTDAALFSVLATADLVLLGCDAILARWLVNKVGTAALLCLARQARIPSYAVAASFKFLPRELEKRFQIRPQPPREVWRIRNRNIAVRNLYFEKALLRNCTGIITEDGVHSPAAIRGLLQKSTLAAGFRSIGKRGDE
ncbi:MAG: translation initiation factor eIF-2B [Acidobacteria bacterium]|nr:translation initiation factor eIF-2B [Acidobacteriota bacterium]